MDLIFINPCFTVDLGLQPSPFSDHTYVLRDPEFQMPWQAENLISPKTTVDCGPITVQFFKPGSVETTLNPELFQDDRTTNPANILKVLYTEKVALKGSYPIKYRIFHSNYPLRIEELDFPFTVTVINACANPVSLLPS